MRKSTKGRVSTFKGRTHTDKARALIAAAHRGRPSPLKGRTHTEATRRLISLNAKRTIRMGADNPAWKGGVTVVLKAKRKAPGYATWRRLVRERAGGYCECCQCDRGTGRMHAHHIEPFATHSEGRHDPENGAWLCDDCHREAHNAAA